MPQPIRAALGLALHEDARFARNRDRLADRETVVDAVAWRLACMKRDAVLRAMESAGVPTGPINTGAEAFADRQAMHRGMVREICAYHRPRSPMRFSDAALASDRPPPRLDADDPALRAALERGDDWPLPLPSSELAPSRPLFAHPAPMASPSALFWRCPCGHRRLRA